MIDEYSSHIPCWLVWSTSAGGLVTLEAICLNNKYAKSVREVLLRDRVGQLVRVTIEKSEANHMFAGDLDEKWWKLYGQEANNRLENTQIEMLKKLLKTYQDAGDKILDAIKSGDKITINKAILNWIHIRR